MSTTETTTSTTGSDARVAHILGKVPKGLLIGDSWRDASDGGTFEVENPATGETIATLASATSEDAKAALDAACAVQEKWVRTPPGNAPRSCCVVSSSWPNGRRNSPP